MFWYAKKGFGNASRNCRQRIGITAERYRISDRFFKILCFQKGDNGFRHCLLTAFHMFICRSDLFQCPTQIIRKFPGRKFPYAFLSHPVSRKINTGRCRLCPLNPLRVVMCYGRRCRCCLSCPFQ